jgi:import inner membrane translocase subunit TIM22
MWETAKLHGKDALQRAGSYAKGFAAFGAVYASSECAVEKFRAKHDIYNAGYAGCFTGSILAVKRCVALL